MPPPFSMPSLFSQPILGNGKMLSTKLINLLKGQKTIFPNPSTLGLSFLLAAKTLNRLSAKSPLLFPLTINRLGITC